MKVLLLLCLVMVSVSCVKSNNEDYKGFEWKTITIDSCEYLM